MNKNNNQTDHFLSGQDIGKGTINDFKKDPNKAITTFSEFEKNIKETIQQNEQNQGEI